VCDGSSWGGYRPRAREFWTVDGARVSQCEDPFNEWSGLAEDLHDAAITGREELHVGDTSIDCAVVRGDYGGSGRSGLRTLWIDDVTKTIWQYRIEGGANRAAPAEPAVRIYTLLSQTSKGVVQPTDFAFQTSIDWTRLTKAPLMRLGDGAPLRPVGAPVVLFKVEPKYTKAAARARIAGRVVLAAEVWPDGAAHNFKVVRSLDPGLDQEAIKAVSKWKFRPGMKDGTLVKVAVTVEVNFRLGK
jgi:TonB family protein